MNYLDTIDALRRERDEAVKGAYLAAAAKCDAWADSVWDVFRDQGMAVRQRAEEIRALTLSDAQAALAARDAERSEQDKIALYKLSYIPEFLNLLGRPRADNFLTAALLIEEAATWARKHIELRGQQNDELQATIAALRAELAATKPAEGK